MLRYQTRTKNICNWRRLGLILSFSVYSNPSPERKHMNHSDSITIMNRPRKMPLIKDRIQASTWHMLVYSCWTIDALTLYTHSLKERFLKPGRTGRAVRAEWSDQSWYPWRDAASSEQRLNMEARWTHSALLPFGCCSHWFKNVGIQMAGKPIGIGHIVAFSDTENGESCIWGKQKIHRSVGNNHTWWPVIKPSTYKTNKTESYSYFMICFHMPT